MPSDTTGLCAVRQGSGAGAPSPRVCTVRDWSLITGRGATKREGACEVLLLRKEKKKGGGGGGGGAEGLNSFSHAEGGAQKVLD